NIAVAVPHIQQTTVENPTSTPEATPAPEKTMPASAAQAVVPSPDVTESGLSVNPQTKPSRNLSASTSITNYNKTQYTTQDVVASIKDNEQTNIGEQKTKYDESQISPQSSNAIASLARIQLLEASSLIETDEVPAEAFDFSMRFTPYWSLYGESGITANPDFAGAGEKTWHYAPYIEVGATRSLSRRLRLGLGFAYSSFTGLNRTASRTERSFGFIGNTKTEILHHDQSQWLSVPVTLEYALLPGIRLTGGGRVSYLTQTHGLLETLEEDDLGIKSTNVMSVNQYMDGLRRFNYQLEAGMAVRLTPRWEIRASAIQGIRSVTSAEVLEGGGNDRTMQLRLGIRWILK
ncbi:MAG: hypothetical protein AB8F95_06660, partial [Bacteroidia bacterium]